MKRKQEIRVIIYSLFELFPWFYGLEKESLHGKWLKWRDWGGGYLELYEQIPATDNEIKVIKIISMDAGDLQDGGSVFQILSFDPSFEIHFL